LSRSPFVKIGLRAAAQNIIKEIVEARQKENKA
jgi:hypothetical protein